MIAKLFGWSYGGPINEDPKMVLAVCVDTSEGQLHLTLRGLWPDAGAWVCRGSNPEDAFLRYFADVNNVELCDGECTRWLEFYKKEYDLSLCQQLQDKIARAVSTANAWK